MNRYGINLHFDVVVPVVVEALDEYEALAKAEIRGYDIDINTGDVFSGVHCITSIEAI